MVIKASAPLRSLSATRRVFRWALCVLDTIAIQNGSHIQFRNQKLSAHTTAMWVLGTRIRTLVFEDPKFRFRGEGLGVQATAFLKK
eukprot:1340400-Amorphochlora_amoeboformis.AAC.2